MLIINKLSKFSKIHAGKVKKGGGGERRGGFRVRVVNVDGEHDDV